jgi:sialate O-acetylesterase
MIHRVYMFVWKGTRMLKKLFFFLLAITVPASAEIKLPHLFSDHSVIQRNYPVHLWGTAVPNEKITVRFHDQVVTATVSSQGQWRLSLQPEKAGGPYTLDISGSTSKPIKRADILVGDVWVASGQSNMEFALRGWAATPNSYDSNAIASANHPLIHLLRQVHITSPTPLSDASAEWTQCTPDTAQFMSATAYFFAVQIQEHENVPIGLISATWPGTPSIAWIPSEGITSHHLDWAEKDAAQLRTKLNKGNNADSIAPDGAVIIEASDGAGQRRTVTGDTRSAHYPSYLFNGMVQPLTLIGIKGVIWYQGESDAVLHRAHEYRQSMPALIESWRKAWNIGNFPFLFVQLPGFANGRDWGWIRDGQRRALSLPETGMATTLDIGEKDLLHPHDKHSVGERLALAARQKVYGENIEGTPPLFIKAKVEGTSIRAYFDHADGLTSRNLPLDAFEIAGADGNFHLATARIEDVGAKPTIVASSPDVSSPQYIRYGWASWVTSYLWNSAGLPMSTFTSEP